MPLHGDRVRKKRGMTDTNAITLSLPEHIAVDESKGAAECATCGVSVHLPTGKFGYVRAVDMLAAFILQHAVHDRKGHASGLTKTGRATKAAMAALAAPTSEGDAR